MIHYLILAHKNPEQLSMLCNSLESSVSYIYAHIDANVDQSFFESYLQKNKIEYIRDRVNIYRWWFSMVQATLNWIKQIFPKMKKNDHIVVMSWQDFPIKSQNYIHTILQKNKWKSFVWYVKQPNDERDITKRVTKYYFHDLIVPDWIDICLKKILWFFIAVPPLRNQIFGYIWQRVVNFFLPQRKTLLKKYNLYRGSQRQILSYDLVKYISELVGSSEGKLLIKLFKNTAGPDELFFQTVFLNSQYKETIENFTHWYMDRKTWDTLPKILTMEDFPLMKNSPYFFARKFDMDLDKNILNHLSSELLHE